MGFNCPLSLSTLLLYLVIILLLPNSCPTEGILPPQARRFITLLPPCLPLQWDGVFVGCTHFLVALQALVVCPKPAPVFLGKPKRVVSRTGEKERPYIPSGKEVPISCSELSPRLGRCAALWLLLSAWHATCCHALPLRPARARRLGSRLQWADLNY